MLTALLWLGIGAAATACLAGLEHRLHGRWVTPFTLFAVPQTCVLGGALLLAQPLGFVGVHPLAPWVILVGTAVLWCGGILVLAPQRRQLRSLAIATRSSLGEIEGRRALLVVSWILVTIMAVAFFRAIQATDFIARIVQLDFQLAFQSGLSGMVRPVVMLLVVYWVGTVRRGEWIAWFTAGALVFFLFLSFVKGTILLPVVGGLIYRVLSGRMGVTVRGLLGAAALGLVVVNAVYMVEVAVWGPSRILQWTFYAALARRIVGYLFAGVLGLSETLERGIVTMPAEWPIIVAPAWNLAARIFGVERVSNVPTDALVIDPGEPILVLAQSNAHTMVGTFYVFWGWWGAVAGVFALGVVMALVFTAALRTGSCWLLVVFSLLGAGLFFGWFEYYFWHPFWYVSVAVGLMLAALVHVGWGRRAQLLAGRARAVPG